MGVIIQMWCGIPLQITEPMAAIFPRKTYDSMPANYCGAGRGLGEKLVPDYVFWYTRWLPGWLDISIKLAIACWIHDKDFELAPPTWDAFHKANSRVYANIKAIIIARTKPGLIRWIALHYPEIYAHSVDTIGRSLFWNLKHDQGHVLPKSAHWLLT